VRDHQQRRYGDAAADADAGRPDTRARSHSDTDGHADAFAEPIAIAHVKRLSGPDAAAEHRAADADAGWRPGAVGHAQPCADGHTDAVSDTRLADTTGVAGAELAADGLAATDADAEPRVCRKCAGRVRHSLVRDRQGSIARGRDRAAPRIFL
jgi:hypothetical protein